MYLCYHNTSFLNNSIQAVVSYYSNIVTKWSNADDLEVRVVYFESRPQVYAYLILEMYTLMRKEIGKLSNKITQTNTLPIGELIDILKDEGIDWNGYKDEYKYGTFFKMKTHRNEKVIATFTRRLDFSNYSSDSKVLFD